MTLKHRGNTKDAKIKLENKIKCKHCGKKFKVMDDDYYIEGSKVTYVCPMCNEEFTEGK